MGYVIAGILVLLIVGGFVAFLVMNSMRKGAGAGTADRSAPQSDRGGPPGIGEDPTPLGDTSEHADDDSAEGYDPAAQPRPEDRQMRDAGAGSGTDTASPGGSSPASPRPDSERLADRPR
jgi:hypothetical protein